MSGGQHNNVHRGRCGPYISPRVPATRVVCNGVCRGNNITITIHLMRAERQAVKAGRQGGAGTGGRTVGTHHLNLRYEGRTGRQVVVVKTHHPPPPLHVMLLAYMSLHMLFGGPVGTEMWCSQLCGVCKEAVCRQNGQAEVYTMRGLHCWYAVVRRGVGWWSPTVVRV